MKFSIENCVVFMLTAFSGIYLRNFLVKPAYVALIFSIALILLCIIYKKVEISTFLAFLIFSFVFYLWCTQVFLEGEYATLIFTSSIVVILFLPNLIKRTSGKIKFALVLVVIFYAIEALIRIRNPDYNYQSDELSSGILDTFYIYKVNSIAFEDSNFVAMVLTCYYILSRVAGRENDEKTYLTSLFLFILIVLTFSRSAYIGIVIFEAMFFYNNNKKYRLLSILGICLVALIAFYFLLDKIESDGSFKSKFYIFELFITYLGNVTVTNIITGVGFGNTFTYLGIGPHNIYIALFIETGVLGLFLYLLIFLYLYLKYTLCRLAIMPIMIMGLSFSPIALPYFYVVISWLIYLEVKDGNYKK